MLVIEFLAGQSNKTWAPHLTATFRCAPSSFSVHRSMLKGSCVLSKLKSEKPLRVSFFQAGPRHGRVTSDKLMKRALMGTATSDFFTKMVHLMPFILFRVIFDRRSAEILWIRKKIPKLETFILFFSRIVFKVCTARHGTTYTVDDACPDYHEVDPSF